MNRETCKVAVTVVEAIKAAESERKERRDRGIHHTHTFADAGEMLIYTVTLDTFAVEN